MFRIRWPRWLRPCMAIIVFAVISLAMSMSRVSMLTLKPKKSGNPIRTCWNDEVMEPTTATDQVGPPVLSLQTVVSTATGPWLPQTDLTKDPCLPIGQEVVSRPGVHYHSSELEQEWLLKSHHLNICNTAEKQSRMARWWINYSHDIFQNTHSRPYREPSPQEAQVLSAFDFGDGEMQYIEPLHGTARMPTMCEGITYEVDFARAVLFNISYLIPANLCGKKGPHRRSKFYDLGCTSNKFRDQTTDWSNFSYTKGSGNGPSIPLFTSMYRDRCVDFDDIYGWEAINVSHVEWFRPIPDEVRPKVHFFNVPVAENPCPESPSGKYLQGGSFLRFLQASASVEDFVVVKVDIDAGPELEIVESIAHRYELSRLVDELYFEYHFEFDNLNFGWECGGWKGRTVDTAINLMYRLRQAGVRSHFWI